MGVSGPISLLHIAVFKQKQQNYFLGRCENSSEACKLDLGFLLLGLDGHSDGKKLACTDPLRWCVGDVIKSEMHFACCSKRLAV